MCPTPTALSAASEVSHFPRTPDFRDARAFEVPSSHRPQFNHLSIANMGYASCGVDSSMTMTAFSHGPSLVTSTPSYPIMSPGCGTDHHQEASNIDPSLWDAGTPSVAPMSSVGTHFYEQGNFQQLRSTFAYQQQQQQQSQTTSASDFAQPTTSNERSGSYLLRSSSQQQLTS